MSCRRVLAVVVVLGASLLPAHRVMGQEEPAPRHGRKYKAPPAVSHVGVTVIRSGTGKPISNAAVIFHPIKDGKDDGTLEVKTDPEGKATIDVIPTGSEMRVQVIAPGYATFGQDYRVDGPTKDIAITMLRPRAQVSAYTNKTDKPSDRKPGVQEPVRPKDAPAPPPFS